MHSEEEIKNRGGNRIKSINLHRHRYRRYQLFLLRIMKNNLNIDVSGNHESMQISSLLPSAIEFQIRSYIFHFSIKSIIL